MKDCERIRKYYHKTDPAFSTSEGRRDLTGISLPKEPWLEDENMDIMDLYERGLSSRQIGDRIGLSSSAVRRRIARRKSK